VSPIWLSGLVYFRPADETICDRVILEVVAPFVREALKRRLVRSYFFARSSDPCLHVRVRLQLGSSFQGAVKELLKQHLAGFPAHLLGRPDGDGVDAGGTVADSLVWLPYVPDLDRYGGASGVDLVAKAFFRDSADISFTFLQKIQAGGLDRQGIGLATMVTLLAAMNRDTACVRAVSRMVFESNASRDLEIEFDRGFARQSKSLTHQITAFWNASPDGSLPSPVASYARAARTTKIRLERLVSTRQLMSPRGSNFASLGEAIEFLAPSYIHMTSNQLGIPNIAEGFLGYAVWRVFDGPRLKRGRDSEPSVDRTESGVESD
jgi:hypothetical protein